MKVVWNENACCHSGHCIKTLPQVFKVEDGKFVVQSGNATEEQVSQVVAACPSKALQME
ncbi:(4Fe-4S)-binding protein [Thiobacillus sp.]